MPANTRQFSVSHTTRYRYDNPIARSSHRLHLRPIHDWKQSVESYTLSIEPQGPTIEYEDVFGNWATRFEITHPYQELTITAESVVSLLDVNPFAIAGMTSRPTFPVVWMPWEQTVLSPYLRPQELPDTEIEELIAYAQGFARRNDNDLLETLFAINLALFHDYQYLPGSTSMATTPYQVMLKRRGVCQDFANLFICMARLLGIPARYVCGYVYTGSDRAARAQSDASHAWVQLYIPNVGWKGFDPTNGVLPQTDHVRVGVGRYFRDTAPTSGSYYGSANEEMEIDVRVRDVTSADDPPIIGSAPVGLNSVT